MPGPQELPRHQYQRMAALEFQKQPRIASTLNLTLLTPSTVTERWKWISIVPRDAWGTLPAIVCIHGGGWAKGNRTNHRNVAQALAAKGFVTAHDFLPAQWRSPLPRRYPGLQSSRSIPPGKCQKLWNRCRQNWSDWTLRRRPFDRVARHLPRSSSTRG